MTLTLEGLGPPASLRLREPVLGIDPSTLRMSAGVLEPRVHMSPAASWSTVTLQRHENLARRQILAYDAIRGWLQRLEANWGPFGHVAVEEPMVGARTVHVSSFYVIGVLLAAIGDACPEAEVVTFPPPRWKLLATGKGYAPGLPKTASRSAKRTAELARIEQWARDACGWTGTVGDESAGLGIATALGVELCRT
jgi:Holliday junction resolvasome RuvABC endonuclease subunit